MKQLLFLFFTITTFNIQAQLTISEILFEPPLWNIELQYFELLNISDDTIDITEWSIEGDINLPFFPELILLPGEPYIFTSNSGALLDHGIFINTVVWSPFDYITEDVSLILKDPNGEEAFKIDYSPDSNWPVPAPGVSIELCNPTQNPNDASNWALAENIITSYDGDQLTGTPSEENTCQEINTSTLSISNSDYFKIYPNPCHSILRIDSPEIVESITVYNLDGTKLLNSTFTNHLDLSEIKNGAYIISIEHNGQKIFKQFIKME